MSRAPLIPVGDEAPDFRLPSTSGQDVRLHDHRGSPVVLYFYPEDHTLGCTVEARRFRTYFEALSLHRATILGVSQDNLENHCTFRDRHQLPFHLLSDGDGAVHDLYRAWKARRFRGDKVVRRCTYLIDPEGRIAYQYPRVNVVGHARQVVADIERLGHERGWFSDHA